MKFNHLKKVGSKPTGADGLVAGTAASRRGMALVITLILLSVTLIMAVAFLAMSRRERGSVTTATDTATARLATDSALAAVQAQIMANVLITNTGVYDYHLLSSTNFLPLVYNQFTIGRVLPRPIVMMTNLTLLTNESRFYLDLNRNGRDDPGSVLLAGDPEWIGVLERPDLNPGPNNKFLARYAFFALPAGNALDLNYIHNRTLNPNLALAGDGFFRNEGVGSWELNLSSFLADLNTNQWNTNASQYSYVQPVGPNSGYAFEDAFSLLSWRYNANYLTLAPNLFLADTLVNAGLDAYTIGNLMATTALPAPLSPSTPPTKNWAGSDSTNHFYALPTELFDPAKSSGSPLIPGFTNRLLNAGAGATAYDRYTFYRMLDQISTDSTADDVRMNLNYRNITNGVVVAGMETNLYPWTALDFFTNAANRLLTNYTADWLAANSNAYVATFGTNVAFGVTHIPVLVSNRFVYTPAVNRLLQLAANIYDASTNNTAALGKNYPSVFRPVFTRTNNDIYITGYSEVSALTSFTSGTAPLDEPLSVTDTNLTLGAAVNAANGNVYDVPWIVGAKKGFPNFNQFTMVNVVGVTRKLQVSKPTLTSSPGSVSTSQMYIFSISNAFGCSLWNSYANNFSGNITISAQNKFTQVLTNDAPGFVPLVITNYIGSVINTNTWAGVGWVSPAPEIQLNSNSFVVAFNTNVVALSNAVYRFTGYNPSPIPHFDNVTTVWQTKDNTIPPANGATPPLPQFGLSTTNQLQVFVLDGAPGAMHVIDYVHFTQTATNLDINAELADPDSVNGTPAYMWSTNLVGSAPSGVPNQLAVSGSQNPAPTPAPNQPNFWTAPVGMPNTLGNTTDAEKAFFSGFFRGPIGSVFIFNGKRYTNTLLTMSAPYTPTRIIYNYRTWQANDPLVHYLASDLSFTEPGITGVNHVNDTSLISRPEVLPLQLKPMVASKHFSPWGNVGWLSKLAKVDQNKFNLRYKDPLVWRPDNWDFPTGKFPTPGWLGRVHRGTPWQTVYLKSSDVRDITDGLNTWMIWSGNTNLFDFTNSVPVADHYLVDLFTTKINDNARHGVLPINVGSGGADPARGLAAWSAVFSGVVALSNSASGPTAGTVPSVTPVAIPPAGWGGLDSPVGLMVSNINVLRTNLINKDGVIGAFEHIGDILRAPLLTEQSPFLNWSDATQQQNGISDELYEWVPQQVMGLLRIATLPRYVVYCYGQALRPAPNSVNLAAGANFGTVTNYQVVAESAARALIRVDKNVIMNTNIITGAVTATGTNYSTTIESYNVLGPD